MSAEIRPTTAHASTRRPKPNMTKSQFDRECPPLYGTWLVSKLGPTKDMKADAAEVLARRDIRLKTRDVQGVPAIKLHNKRTRRHTVIAGFIGGGLLTLGIACIPFGDVTAQTPEQSIAPSHIESGQPTGVTKYLGDITCSGSAVKVTMEEADDESPARAATRVTGEPFRDILPRARAEAFWQDRQDKLGPVAEDGSFMIQPGCSGLTKGH